jgi:hypothetical protein
VAGIDSYYRTARDTYAQILHPTVAAIRALTRKPVIIAETGIAAPVKWPQVADLFAGIRSDHLAAVFYFDACQVPDCWRLEGHPYAEAEFARWTGHDQPRGRWIRDPLPPAGSGRSIRVLRDCPAHAWRFHARSAAAHHLGADG